MKSINGAEHWVLLSSQFPCWCFWERWEGAFPPLAEQGQPCRAVGWGSPHCFLLRTWEVVLETKRGASVHPHSSLQEGEGLEEGTQLHGTPHSIRCHPCWFHPLLKKERSGSSVQRAPVLLHFAPGPAVSPPPSSIPGTADDGSSWCSSHSSQPQRCPQEVTAGHTGCSEGCSHRSQDGSSVPMGLILTCTCHDGLELWGCGCFLCPADIWDPAPLGSQHFVMLSHAFIETLLPVPKETSCLLPPGARRDGSAPVSQCWVSQKASLSPSPQNLPSQCFVAKTRLCWVDLCSDSNSTTSHLLDGCPPGARHCSDGTAGAALGRPIRSNTRQIQMFALPLWPGRLWGSFLLVHFFPWGSCLGRTEGPHILRQHR